MKKNLIKRIKIVLCFSAFIGMLSLSSCSNTISSNNSTPPSDSSKTNDSPDSPGGNIINGGYSTEIDYLEGEEGEKIEVQRITSDGEPIACFLCPERCDIYNETVKLCFYSNGEVRYRATSLDEKSFEWRYDKYRGTYTGDPTKKDVEITINFSRKGNFFTYYTYSIETGKMNESYHAGYEPITENTEAKIKIENDVLKFLECDFKESHFTDSYEDFIRTSVSDLGPYRYDEIKSREEKYPEILNIPEEYSSIAEDAFCEYASFSEYQDKDLGENKLLKKVILPSTIKEIGPYAFYNCIALEEINIPEGCKEIGECAFYNCNALKKLVLPSTLEKVGKNAFYGIQNDRSLEIEFAKGISKIPDSTLESITGIKSITIPSSVRVVGKRAFYNCIISEPFDIPEGVEEIGEEAFYMEQNLSSETIIQKLELPSTIKKIGPKAFWGKKIKKLVLNSAEEISMAAFYNKWPNADGAGILEELVLPDNLKFVGDSAFYGNKIQKLVLPEKLEEIGICAFNNDTKNSEIDEVIINSNLKRVEHDAFPMIKKIVLTEGVEEICKKAFSGLYIGAELVLPSTLKKIGDEAFYGSQIIDLTIPEGVTEIGARAFYNHNQSTEALKTLKLPSTIKTIGKQAFYMNNLTSLVIPDGVEEICDESFYGSNKNQGLNTLTLPTTIKKIGKRAFNYNTLTTIEIPEGVEEIGEEAFYRSTKLQHLSLPSTLKSLNRYAFPKHGLKTINYNGDIFSFAELFDEISLRGLNDLTITCGQEDVSAFFTNEHDENVVQCQWENTTDNILLTLKRDGNYIMKNLSNSQIGKGMWYDDSGLKTITLYSNGGIKSTYNYSSGIETLAISGIGTFNPVNRFSVIEKEELTDEKWCDNAVMIENGKYIYYQYYLERVVSDNLNYVDTIVYYRDNKYSYHDKCYKKCKNKIESFLNSKDYSYSSDTINGKTVWYIYVDSDPQLEL